MQSLKRRVAIIGLGYVGLPLLVTTARSGWQTIGVDTDHSKISELNKALSPVEDVSNQDLANLLQEGKIEFSTSIESVAGADVVVFCLPTPIRESQPDLNILLTAVQTYAPFFKDEVLIVSESSSYPGTLRSEVIPICERYRGKKRFFYGHSPERVDPGNKVWNNSNTPRIISGIDNDSLAKMREFYESFCNRLVEVDTPEIAEAAKMFENSFRQVNIALVNEFSRYCHKVGIPAQKVLEAAATKPFGFMKFNFGAGVGGHCIPVDPYYLANHARINETSLDLIELSNKINRDQPQYVLQRVQRLLGAKFDTSRILVVGLSYKANTSDRRESPGVELLQLVKDKVAQVNWYDPLCDQYPEVPRDDMDEEYDLAVVVTKHDNFDYSPVFNRCARILDCTQLLQPSEKVFQL